MKSIVITLPLMGIALAGCLPQDPTVGAGEITLSPGVQTAFEEYQKERSPGHFAVAADGTYASYNYCPDGRCYRGSKNAVIYNCEKGSRGSPCKIYGAYGEVVWVDPEGSGQIQ